MNGSLIVRLVDITLLLLLSLMAAASFTTTGLEPPFTNELEEEGVLLAPMQIGIAPDGSIHTQHGASITLEELESLLDQWPAEVEFIADARAPAVRLLAVHAVARHLNRKATFRVRQRQGDAP
ncbi:MAG: hypothetical protein OXI05_09125 [Bacteroidota bacterium]|nr:hypothetical protein [Bacteroidota bacterium]MDE2645984.1 hypothetical protein [Bacteroidota bacterium]MXW33957.1 hypothetical protein [Rhodothermaceae bacterium]MYE63728.1 hypothetical protein [Rhodothermaceae bacterium]MYJ21545.1 hypothetical protein [Rhodothermaceae bacterium]